MYMYIYVDVYVCICIFLRFSLFSEPDSNLSSYPISCLSIEGLLAQCSASRRAAPLQTRWMGFVHFLPWTRKPLAMPTESNMA